MKLILSLVAALSVGPAFAQVQYSPPGTAINIVAEVLKPSGTADTGALRTTSKYVLLYDSGDVAAGAVINSPDIDTSGITQLAVVCLNAHTVARVLTANFKTVDGTAIYFPTGNCAPGARTAFSFGQDASGAAALGPFVIPAKMQFSLAALGAANGRLWVYGR